MTEGSSRAYSIAPPLNHPILPEILLEPWPLQRQLLLEIIRPLTERTVGETIVIESRLIGDFGDAEFRNRQIGNRPGSFGLGYDERRIRPAEHIHAPAVFLNPHGIPVLDDYRAAALDEFGRDTRIDFRARLRSACRPRTDLLTVTYASENRSRYSSSTATGFTSGVMST